MTSPSISLSTPLADAAGTLRWVVPEGDAAIHRLQGHRPEGAAVGAGDGRVAAQFHLPSVDCVHPLDQDALWHPRIGRQREPAGAWTSPHADGDEAVAWLQGGPHAGASDHNVTQAGPSRDQEGQDTESEH